MTNTTASKTPKVAKIEIDRSKCISAATCVVIAPLAFDLDKGGIAVLKDTYKDVDAETIIQAAQSCPTVAIHLYDEDGNKII